MEIMETWTRTKYHPVLFGSVPISQRIIDTSDLSCGVLLFLIKVISKNKHLERILLSPRELKAAVYAWSSYITYICASSNLYLYMVFELSAHSLDHNDLNTPTRWPLTNSSYIYPLPIYVW